MPLAPGEPDHPGVPFPPPIAFGAPLALALLAELAFPTSFGGGILRWLMGGALAALAAFFAGGGYFAQRRAGTDPLPHHASTAIVTAWPYDMTRNPMYLGFAIATAGLAALVDSTWALLAVPVGVLLVDRLVIVREERYLERKFGEEYLSYKRRVRRWL